MFFHFLLLDNSGNSSLAMNAHAGAGVCAPCVPTGHLAGVFRK